jgi:O-antigen/teichoic acid export membrane protein
MNKVVGFILLPIYSRYFLISEYGLLALFDTIIDFIGMFSSFGIVEAFKRWYWEDKDREKQNTIFTTVFVFSLIMAIVFSLILYVVLRHFSTLIFGVEISQRLINIYIISIIANIIMQRIFILLRTRRMAKTNMVYNVLRALVTCLATVVFIVHFDLGMESIFLARIIGIAVTLIFLIPEFLRNISWRIDTVLLGKMLKFSYPLAISSSLSLLFTLSDRW